ncbi:aminoacyl-tRNA hydrolase [bacterium]|nr:aminoacyl-tRNA hydrolase [bacterium]MBU1984716.1 aminoacyl-tRNA hydrolase [bacterium]
MPLIVGLGNPGKEYQGTPHNVGFAVVSRLAEQWGIGFRRSRSGEAEEAVRPGEARAVLLRPLSYMNLSGRPVSAALRWYDLPISELLVICDDVNLPAGHLRLRFKGGSGGQKGLQSIVEHLGTEEFARLRIGVGGGDPRTDVAEYVLSRVPAELRLTIDEAVARAANAVECYLRDGLDAAMNRFNTPHPVNSEQNPSGENGSPDANRPEGEP